MLEQVTVTRYVAPLREGGSLPAAALYFHHNWPTASPARPFDARDHVLAGRATRLAEAHEKLVPLLTEELLTEVTGLVPTGWFSDQGGPAYVAHLLERAPQVPAVIRT